ncbi:MAG: hypothetical protein ACXVAY_19420 [Mucilaginibacter sp.]
MKVVTIKYKSSKTLDALRDLGKYLGFTIDEHPSQNKEKISFINGVPIIPGDDSIDITALHSIFTGKGLNATELRNKEWQRKL